MYEIMYGQDFASLQSSPKGTTSMQVCYSESERKEEAKKRLEKRLEKRVTLEHWGHRNTAKDFEDLWCP